MLNAEGQKEKNTVYQHNRWLRDKEKIFVLRKKYRTENPEKVKKQKHESYMRNREQTIAKVKQYAKDNWQRIKGDKRKYRQSPKGRLLTYKKSASVRGLEFNLSVEEFNKLLLNNCHYCGKEKSNGIDRIDSNLGYSSDNVLSCCSTCNYMKRDMIYDNFIEQIKKIFNNFS